MGKISNREDENMKIPRWLYFNVKEFCYCEIIMCRSEVVVLFTIAMGKTKGGGEFL